MDFSNCSSSFAETVFLNTKGEPSRHACKIVVDFGFLKLFCVSNTGYTFAGSPAEAFAFCRAKRLCEAD